MFGATTAPFGQPSAGPLPSQAAFDQPSNAGNNPFAVKPFGTTQSGNLFSTQSSIIGGNSTGVFGVPQTGNSIFGVPQTWNNSTGLFGVNQASSPFGSSTTSPFGGSSGFGQKPLFGQTGSQTASQTSPFGGVAAQLQPRPFGGSSQSASSTSPFGQSNSTFGNTQQLGTLTSPFGSTTSTSTAFGQPQPFGGSSQSAFTTPSNNTTASPFGGSSSGFGPKKPLFGPIGSTPASQASPFGGSTAQTTFTTSKNIFGASSQSPFSNPSNNAPFGSGSGFGQSSSSVGSTQLGTSTTTPFAVQQELPDSRGSPYTTMSEDPANRAAREAFESISAMPQYQQKSHEELRLEDYQSWDKGGPAAKPNGFGSPWITSQQTANPFATGLGQTTTPSPFATPATSSTVGSTSFGVACFTGFAVASTPSGLGNFTGFGGTSTPSPSSISVAAPVSTTSTTTSVTGEDVFNVPCTGSFFRPPSFTAPNTTSNPTGLTPPALGQTSQPLQTSGFPWNQTQPASTTGGLAIPACAAPSPVSVQPAVPATNPYGTLPATPQVSLGRTSGTSAPIQYGISSLPVGEYKSSSPAPARISSLLTSRHLSQRHVRLPLRKYTNSKNGDYPKLPFFIYDEEAVLSSVPKADSLFVARENPRALVILPKEQWPLMSAADKASPLKVTSSSVPKNGKLAGEGSSYSEDHKGKTPQEDGLVKVRQNIEIEALLPKLGGSDFYYTEPGIEELAAKERAEQGFCCHVKDFVVGRIGYGSIKFLGETDVQGIDLESLVQLNHREVIVYPDEVSKPPVGQGLNKPAEVTILNITFTDKKTGRQYTEGPMIDKFKQMLKQKAEGQGAEFVSYDAMKAEWKFRVKHF